MNPICLRVVAGLALGLLGLGRADGLSPSDLPPPAQKTVQAQLAGRTITGIEKIEEDGDVSYQVEAKSAAGDERGFAVSSDGTLLAVETTLAEVPAPVQAAIAATAGAGKVESINQTFDDGTKNYTATIATNGQDRDYTFHGDGTLAKAEADVALLPAPLQAAITTAVGTGKLVGVDKSNEDGEMSYTATIAVNGKEHDFIFMEDGTLTSEEVDLEGLAPAVQAAIKAEVGTGKLEGIDQNFDDGEVTFDATMTLMDGEERDFTVSDSGQMVDREVTLAEVPERVQQTITAQLGAGQVTYIDQTLDTPKHFFEVEAVKDGKDFDFIVGPRGKFLGMEE